MKKIMLAVVLAIMAAGQVKAGTIDGYLSDAWASISASKNFHLLDNASADVFKNLNKREYYGGTSTYLYKYWYLSANFIILRPLDTSSYMIPGGAIKLHAGEMLYTIPQVKSVVDYLGKQSMIDSVTMGIGYGRSFATSTDMIVIYGGLIKKF